MSTEEKKIGSLVGSILKGIGTVATKINPVVGAISSLIDIGKAIYDISGEFEQAIDLTSELNAQLAVENSTIDTLFGRLNNATKGTQEYESAKSAIIGRYGSYLQGMGSEIESLEDVRGAYEAVKNAARESITERMRATKIEQQTSIAMKGFESADDKIYDSLKERLKGSKFKASDVMPQIRAALEAENTTILSDAEAAYNRVQMALQKTFNKKDATSVFNSISGGVKEWLDASQELNSSLADIDSQFASASKSSATKVGVKQKPEQLQQPQKPAVDTAAIEAERKRAAAIRAEETLREALANVADDTQQAVIDAKEDGFDKELSQIELNYSKKQKAIELWEAQCKQKVVDAQKTDFLAKDGKEEDFKVNYEDANFAKIDKQSDAMSAANDAQQVDATQAMLDNLRQQWLSWGDEYQQIEAKMTDNAIKAQRDRDSITAAVATGKITKEEGVKATDMVNAGEKNVVADLSAAKAKLSSDFSFILRDLQGLSNREVKTLIDEINKQLENSELSAVDAAALTEQLKKAQDYSATLNPFAGLVNGIKDVKEATEKLEQAKQKLEAVKGNPASTSDEVKEAESAVSAAEKKVKEDKERRNKSASASIKDVSGVASATSDLLKTFGVESPAVDGVVGSLAALGEINFSNPMSIITGGLKAVTSLLGGIFGEMDAVKERKIQEIQKQVDALEKSYDTLGESVEKAYSSDASNMIRQQNQMLEQQKVLINQQIKEEEGKKKSDDGKIAAYKQSLEEIDKQLASNSVKAQDAIFGEDVKSAINEFANAYVAAWAAGDDRAKAMKDVVKNMIKGVITEMLKSDLAPTIQRIRDEIESMLVDGVIDDYEQSRLDGIIDEATSSANKKYEWADKYVKDEKPEEELKREAAKRGIATASQESVDENNGLLTAIQIHTSELNTNLSLMIPEVTCIKNSVGCMLDNAAVQLDVLYGIRENTAPIAAMKSEISAMKNDINTLVIKGITIRS